MVSFTTLPFYPRGNHHQNFLYRQLSGPRSQSGCYGEEKNLLPLTGIKPRSLGHPDHNLAATLSYPGSGINNNNNSILYYLCAESTATRPITDTAKCRYK
jgi:hypothetical protein